MFKGAKVISSWKNVSEGGNQYTKLYTREFSDDYQNKQESDDKSKEEPF